MATPHKITSAQNREPGMGMPGLELPNFQFTHPRTIRRLSRALPCTALITLLAWGVTLATAAPPTTLDDFSAALDEAKVPAPIEELTGDKALLAHVQGMASSGIPASVALARTCGIILVKYHVEGAAVLAANSLPVNSQAPIDASESIRLAVLIDHLIDVCDKTDDIAPALTCELMVAIARECPTVLGRSSAAQYLADLAVPPPTSETVPTVAPLATAVHAFDITTDAIFAAPDGHLSLDTLRLLQSPEEFFDHYVRIKATLLPTPTQEGIEGIIDGLSQRVIAAQAMDKSDKARTILKDFAGQLDDIRGDAAERAEFLIDERHLKDAVRVIVDAADREDAKALQSMIDPVLHVAEHLRAQISGESGAQHIVLTYAAMEEPDDPADATRILQVFMNITDRLGKTKPAKVAATFKKDGERWVLAAGLGLDKK